MKYKHDAMKDGPAAARFVDLGGMTDLLSYEKSSISTWHRGVEQGPVVLRASARICPFYLSISPWTHAWGAGRVGFSGK